MPPSNTLERQGLDASDEFGRQDIVDSYIRPTTVEAKGRKNGKASSSTKANKKRTTLPPNSPTRLANEDLTCVDLFAGCGGLSLGLEQAGFRPLLFSEINKHAAETYIANRAGKHFVPIGDIYQLTDINLQLLKTAWRYQGIENVDLVCGGPPCQGYSGIGHRRTFKLDKKDIPSNHLFVEMVRVIRGLRPKLFLFENVRGLLNSRWTPYGNRGEIFSAVQDEFATLTEYRIRWELLYAKDYGVPQNRPRIVMVGIREDIVSPELLFRLGRTSTPERGAVDAGLLPAPSGSPPTLAELLSDLEDSEYLGKKATTTYVHEPLNEVQRLLRTTPEGRVLGIGEPLTDQEYSDHSDIIREKFSHMIRNSGHIPEHLRTKKFAQRVLPKEWSDDGPNLTITSLPEDYVHYRQPRAPTVREWARMQTFPDWYLFKGPRTTGGRRRAGDPDQDIWDREVPRYTQIGNAVPVLLARKIGDHIRELLQHHK